MAHPAADVATAPLCLEYEDVCSRPEHVAAAGFNLAELGVFLDAVVGLVEPVEAWFLWRPQLRDPGDELVLEAAVVARARAQAHDGRATAITTLNRRHFLPGATRFGIEVLLPRDTLGRVTQ